MKDYIDNEIRSIKSKILISLIFSGIYLLIILFSGISLFEYLDEIYYIFGLALYCVPLIMTFMLYINKKHCLENDILYFVSIFLNFISSNFVSAGILIWAYLDKRKFIKFLKQEEMGDIKNNKNVNANSNTVLKSKEAFPNLSMEEIITPEAKKIDTLMKVGVVFVIFAGFLFATTSDSIIFDMLKPFLLLLSSFMFYGLSKFFSTKVIIKKSEYLYYFLCHLFIFLFCVALGFFETFGEWFSFNGDGDLLFIVFLLVELAISFRIIGNKFNNNLMKKISYGAIYFSLITLCVFFELEFNITMLLILIVSLVMYSILKNDNEYFSPVRNLVLVISFIYLIFNINWCYDVLEYSINFLTYFTFGLNIMTLFKDNFKRYLSILCSSGLVYLEFFITKILSEFNNGDFYIITFLFIFTCLFLVLFYINGRDKKFDMNFNIILISLVVLNSLFVCNFEDFPIIAFLTNFVIFGYILFNIFFNKELKNKSVLLIVQYLYLLSSFALFNLVLDSLFSYSINYMYFSMIYICFIGLLNYLEDKYFVECEFDKPVYILTIIAMYALSFFFIVKLSVLINLFMFILLVGYRFYFDKIEKDNLFLNYFLFVLGFVHLCNLSLMYLFNYTNIILFFLLVIAGILLYKNKRFFTISMLFALLPYFNFITELDLIEEVLIILIVIPLLIMVHLFSKCMLDCSKKARFIFEIICMSLVFMIYSFRVDIIVGLFNFIIGILFIFIGYKNEKFESLFYEGIGLLVLNVIVQFSEYWFKIPLSVYIFFVGVLLVGFATYKEFNKNKVKNDIKKVDTKIEYHEEKEYNTTYNIFACVALISALVVFAFYFLLKEEVEEKFEIDEYNIKVDKYIDEFNIDKNKYFFTYNGSYSHKVYILEYNTLDPYNYMEYFDTDDVSFYWCSKEQLDSIKKSYNNYDYDYYNYYDCYDSRNFSIFENDKSNVYHDARFTVEIMDKIYSYNFDNYSYYNYDLELNVSEYESEKFQFCVHSIFDITVSGANIVETYTDRPNSKCYYASGTNTISFKYNDNYYDNNDNNYDDSSDEEDDSSGSNDEEINYNEGTIINGTCYSDGVAYPCDSVSY